MVSLHAKRVAEITADDLDAGLGDTASTYRNAMIREIRAVLNWCKGGSRKWLSEKQRAHLVQKTLIRKWISRKLVAQKAADDFSV